MAATQGLMGKHQDGPGGRRGEGEMWRVFTVVFTGRNGQSRVSRLRTG